MRYELSLSPQYVTDWGLWEAVRELKQNVIDADGEKTIEYDADRAVLRIGNTNAVLSPSTLLLGQSSKRDDVKSIGKYGEGYKLAMLVLTRMNKRVKVLTGDSIWIPKIVHSQKYGTDILVVDTTTQAAGTSDTMFEVHGVTKHEFNQLIPKSLYFDPPAKAIETSMGRILIDSKFAGKVYVNGLFVCDMVDKSSDKVAYGYDFSPEYIELDRDRNKVSEFDAFWASSRMVIEYLEKGSVQHGVTPTIVHKFIESGYRDLSYIGNMYLSSSAPMVQDICELSYEDFRKKHGPKAFPVTSHSESEEITSRYVGVKPVVVNNTVQKLIKASPVFQSLIDTLEVIEEKTPADVLGEFMKVYGKTMPRKMKKEFKSIVEESSRWVVGE